MKVVSIVNEKGGAGKTTTAINYFGSYITEGKRPVIIDLDVNGKAAHIISNMGDGSLRGSVLRADKVDEVTVLEMIKTLEDNNVADVVILDTPPEYGTAFETAINIAVKFRSDGFIVIPCQPSIQDIALTHKTIESVQNYVGGLVFIQPTNTRKNEHMTQVLKTNFINKPEVELLPSLDRSAPLTQAALMGQTIHEYKPKAHIKQMVDEARLHMESRKLLLEG